MLNSPASTWRSLCGSMAFQLTGRTAGRASQSPRQVHDALPLTPAVLDSLHIRSKQFGGITPLHGCRVRKPIPFVSLGGAAAVKCFGLKSYILPDDAVEVRFLMEVIVPRGLGFKWNDGD